MQRAELAARLVAADEAQRKVLLRENAGLADVALAYALKEICWDAWTVDPARSIKAAAALQALAKINNQQEIGALAAWVLGIAALVEGRMHQAIARLDEAHAIFSALGKDEAAAASQVSKLIALSLLGRYDEAIACGLQAREVFLAHNDLLAAGKIEHNIGNLFFRRDRYRDAEKFQTSAREKFTKLNHQRQLATINNCLANTHALLHKFNSAEQLYREAMDQAERAALPVTLAEIEGNIGNFALLQGRYDRALDYLERSRRRYASLGMAHQCANAEHDIADAYLELNLVPEAAELYQRIIPTFKELGLRAEEARALAYSGRAAALLAKPDEAAALFERSRALYHAEGNEVGAAVVTLSQAQLRYVERDYAQARRLAREAQPAFIASGSWQRLLLARWLEGDCERALDSRVKARQQLQTTLSDAQTYHQPQIVARCQTSLGLLAEQAGEPAHAEKFFRLAIETIEKLRAPLPGEEFRTSFFSDKLVPYTGLVRICLAGGRTREALESVEAARSRTLVELVAGAPTATVEPHDEFEADLLKQAENLSAELSYVYNQLDRPVRGQSLPSPEQLANLQAEQERREQQLLTIMRQLDHRRRAATSGVDAFSLASLQQMLPANRALVEYTTIDDELLAFVVTNDGLKVIRRLALENEVLAEIEQFRFQIDALRFGSLQLRKRLPLLTDRILSRLRSLYDKLIRPLENSLGQRHVIISPHRGLHYLPFHALHNGDNYLIEQREVSYAASASVLQQNLTAALPAFRRAALFGVADQTIPHVHDEVKAIANVFSEPLVFLDETATIAALRAQAANADVLHLACHANFRADNPLFSSLRLGDGWFTVRDATGLKFGGSLVSLSACETGINAIAPGEELIGLARGFFAAGSPAVLLSLWTVDDEATASLMSAFYTELQKHNSPSQALRRTQMALLKKEPHPFFWSAFALVGRW